MEKMTESEVTEQSLLSLPTDVWLWRNNIGAFHRRPSVCPRCQFSLPSTGFIRYGLANESERQNKVIKSSDYIGWKSRMIRAEDVGQTVAQFVSVEFKKSDWKWDSRADAQSRWIKEVKKSGGIGLFINHPKQVETLR